MQKLKKKSIIKTWIFLGILVLTLQIFIAQARLVFVSDEPLTDIPDQFALSLIQWYPSSVAWTPSLLTYFNLYDNRFNLHYLQFYYADWSDGFPNIFNNSSLFYFYSNHTYWQPGSTFPVLPNDSSIRYMHFNDSYHNFLNNPTSFPVSWENAASLQNIYLQRCKYSTAQVDAFIIELEIRTNNGMGNAYTGIHQLYLSGTGVNANGTPTILTHTANGWIDFPASKYLEKTFGELIWRVYYN